MKSKITQFADGFRPNILHSGVRVSFYVFHFTYCQVSGNVPGVFRSVPRMFQGVFRTCSGVFRDAPLFPTMATPVEKALCSPGSRCRKVRLSWYKAVSGLGKT